MLYRTCRGLALGFLAVLLSTDAAFGATYKIDIAHSSVGFSVRHIVSRTTGRFNDFKGRVVYDEANPSASTVSATIQIAGIDTDNERRDNHLRSADFFNAEKFKTLNFTSSSIKRLKENTYQISGELTMHGVSKEITLDAIYRGHQKNPANNKEAEAFQITGTLNRSDFNIGNDFAESLISDEVKIEANIEFIQQ